MWPVSGTFLAALRASHRVATRVDAYTYGGALLASDLPVKSGEVKVDASSDVRRSIEVTLAKDPALDVGTVLSPYTAELRAYRGITFVDGTTELVPLGRFRVDNPVVAADGTVKVTGPDRSKRIIDARFTSPTQSVTGNTVPAEIARLVTAAEPGIVVLDMTGATAHPPKVLWDTDRWAAINDLATSIGADAYFDPAGNLVIVPAPAITDPVAWMVDAGETGVMVDFAAATSRDRTYNGVRASGERTDGTPPVTALVVDDDPASPTYWYGAFGKVVRFYASPLLYTVGQATSAGRKILDRTRALNRQLRLVSIVNPALDGGDVIVVRYPDSTYERCLIDAFTVPVDVVSPMQISTRSTQPAQE